MGPSFLRTFPPFKTLNHYGRNNFVFPGGFRVTNDPPSPKTPTTGPLPVLRVTAPDRHHDVNWEWFGEDREPRTRRDRGTCTQRDPLPFGGRTNRPWFISFTKTRVTSYSVSRNLLIRSLLTP